MLHPALEQLVAAERAHDFRRAASRAGRAAGTRPNATMAKLTEIMIRDAQPDDSDAIVRLSRLDGRRPPGGRVVLASVGGAIRAAVGTDGVVVSDPFVPTEDLVALLRIRADQLAGGRGR